MSLVRVDCPDAGCAPIHAYCVACRSWCCLHVAQLIVGAHDPDAAIRALPPWDDPQPALTITGAATVDESTAWIAIVGTPGVWRGPGRMFRVDTYARLSPATEYQRAVVWGCN